MRSYYDRISGLAGAVVFGLLGLGLAIQYNAPITEIGIIVLVAWAIGKFADWKRG